MTPLMLAAHRNNIDIIQLLFKHDACEIKRLNVEINDAVSAHSNLNVYKALASPMYLISVHPTNPIHEALALRYYTALVKLPPPPHPRFITTPWTSTGFELASLKSKSSVLTILPTGLKLSNLGIALITRSHVLSCSSRLHFSSQVCVEQVEFLVKLCQAYLMHNLHKVVLSLNLQTITNLFNKVKKVTCWFSYELHQWSLWEYEFHHEYQTMAQNVEQFALDLLDLTHPEELETLLVKGPSGKELETVTHAVELERKNVS